MGKLFDPSGKLRDPESLRSIYLGRTTRPRQWVDGDKKITEILHEADGQPAAQSTEHSSGRIDAEVFVRPVSMSQGTI